jgi:hypothetical protein
MKPTNQQKDLISEISKEIAGWANLTNIGTISHLQSINDFCVSLELQTYQTEHLSRGLQNLLEVIIEVEEIK